MRQKETHRSENRLVVTGGTEDEQDKGRCKEVQKLCIKQKGCNAQQKEYHPYFIIVLNRV